MTVTRAVGALRWAVGLATNGGLREAVRSWGESNRNHKLAHMVAESDLVHGYIREIQRQQLQCTQGLEVQLRKTVRRCEEWRSMAAGASRGGQSVLAGMEQW